jgi:predicted AAA+ superfamily ATPase
LPNEETKRHYVQSVKDTVLLRDIIQRYAIKDPKLLEDLFIYVINNASTLLSISNIVQYLKAQNRKTSYDTIALYLGYIEETFMIHKAQRYEIKGKELLNGNVKYYINDLAYRNFLYSGFAYGYGFQLENLVYLTLKRHGYDLYVGIVPNKEVDFVAKRGNNTLYVQCSYVMTEPTTIEREYASLEAIKDHYPKIVVSMDDIALPNKGGIEHILAWNLDAYLAQ